MPDITDNGLNVEYLNPPCFTSNVGLHFSPLGMEISVALDSGAARPLGPIGIDGYSDVVHGLLGIKAASKARIVAGDSIRDIDDVLADLDERQIGTACATLDVMSTHAEVDAGEWERFLAVYGWDEWPPAVQSACEGRLDSAAAMHVNKAPAIATYCWEFAMRRSMDEQNLLIDDRQFFEVGLPHMCPQGRFRKWNDLAPAPSRGIEAGGHGR